MLRNSSTWRSRALLTLALALCAGDASALCLPPFVDGGRRLHEKLVRSRVHWLPLLLRQHELCWRAPGAPGELRVLVVGNSGVFGLKLPPERALAAELSRRFAEGSPRAYFFNVAHAFAFQLKDALILRNALDFGADFIVYGLNLSDFQHRVTLYPAMVQFFDSNRREMARFTAERPAGLGGVLALYRRYYAHRGWSLAPFAELRQVGLFARDSVRYRALRLRESWFRMPPPALPRFEAPQPYDCGKRLESFHEKFAGWEEWNVLAWLEEVQRERGIGVLVVNWPVAHNPRDACYNARYPAQAFEGYNAWLEQETRRRGLLYLDLHDQLRREEIFDSVHLTAGGNRRVAERIDPVLRPALAALAGVGAPLQSRRDP